MRTAESATGPVSPCLPEDRSRKTRAAPEVRKTGVYILIGPSESAASGMSIYVGEGDEVWSRLASHDANKDFWTYVVVFVSKDENLTKAMCAGLKRPDSRIEEGEARRGLQRKRTRRGKLPEADTADMETYFDNVRLLLPTLGVNAFAVDATPNRTGSNKPDEVVLELRWEDAKAECVVRDGQFVVQRVVRAGQRSGVPRRRISCAPEEPSRCGCPRTA